MQFIFGSGQYSKHLPKPVFTSLWKTLDTALFADPVVSPTHVPKWIIPTPHHHRPQPLTARLFAHNATAASDIISHPHWSQSCLWCHQFVTELFVMPSVCHRAVCDAISLSQSCLWCHQLVTELFVMPSVCHRAVCDAISLSQSCLWCHQFVSLKGQDHRYYRCGSRRRGVKGSEPSPLLGSPGADWLHSGHRRTRQAGRGGGATALPNSGKTVGKMWAKQEEKKLCKISGKSTPLPPLTEKSPYAHDSGPPGNDSCWGPSHIVLGRGWTPEVVGPRAVPYCPYGQSAPGTPDVGFLILDPKLELFLFACRPRLPPPVFLYHGALH